MIPNKDTDHFSAAKGSQTSTTDSSRKAIIISSSNNSSKTSSSSWSRLKDPRIVRVSRALGGKDRHSKVYTVRGLRDRRVRLSVQTAIQLYDLQDRLGLNQPSKVVDWLLNEAKNAIDELPPLHYPAFMYESQHQHHHHHHEFLSAELDRGLDISSGMNWGKGKDSVVYGEASSSHGNEDYCGRNEEEERTQLQLMMGDGNNQSSTTMSDFLTRQSVRFPSLLSGGFPQNPFLRWDAPNMNLSQVSQRRHELQASQTNDNRDEDLPSLAASHPFLVYHQPARINATFDSGPSQISRTDAEF